MGLILLLMILVILAALVVTNIRIVPQQKAFVVERLGRYQTVWRAGVHVKTPLIEAVVKQVDLREQIADFEPQPVITKDNVTMQIDTVVFYHVFDARLYAYGVHNPIAALENLTATTLRNIIGDMELDATLTSRDTINSQMRLILDEATDPWGIKVNRVELKNIIPPEAIREAMEKQMKAERERREQILLAEGEKQSAILRAQADKEAAILRAEAGKAQLIQEAEGHAESIRLHKEAEAEGLLRIREAEAEGIRKLLDAGMSQEQILKIKSLEAFEKASDGQATKIIIPSEIQGLAGLAEGVKQSVTK